MMNLHTSMGVFVEVAKSGSFTQAARKLSMSATAVSRRVAELERELGVTLLRRTTRQVSLTEAGARYLPRSAAILEEIAALNAEISAENAAPRGRLRITAPPAVGNDWIAKLAVDFAETYPEIELELELTERIVDLVGEGYDAAIRSGVLPSSSLIGHRIVEMRYLLCASPSYLAHFGTPRRPVDITAHQCIYWCGGSTGTTWTFTKGDVQESIPIRSRLLISHFSSLHESAIRGLGLAVLPALSMQDELKAGRLVHVLPDYELDRDVLSLIRPAAPFEPLKLRVFIDFITTALRQRAAS